MTSNEVFKMATKTSNGVKMMNGYRLANPISLMRAEKKNGVIHCDTPYGFHFDLPINGLMNGLNTMTAGLFKKLGEDFTNRLAKKVGANVKTKYFAYVDGCYVRFELYTSHESITDAMEANLPLLNLEFNIVKKEHFLGRMLTRDELNGMYEVAEKETNELLKKVA